MQEEVQITNRQAKILAAIVKEHCNTCKAVGSKELAEKYDFGLSAPSIRNEMQRLEKAGYIKQRHTSSGRVPTDKGYRYFVNQLMERFKLSVEEQNRLKKELLKLQMMHVELGRRIAKLLSESTQAASFAIFPEEISAVGLSNILDNPALPAGDAKEIAEFFDHIDEYAEKIVQDYGEETSPKTFIGKELELSKHSDYSMIISGLKLPGGKRGVIGLIGPKTMKYEKNLSLMEFIAKLLSGGMGVILLILI